MVITLVLVGAEGFVIRAQGARYAITREIGVCGAEIEHPVYLAGVELHAQRITRAKGVVLLQAELQSKPITAGKASPKAQAAGGLFHQIQIQVDLVWRARNLRGFDRHIAEIAQPVDPVPREFYFVAVVPGCFELPELPAHHDIARAIVTRQVDLSHIGPARGVSLQNHGHTVVDSVNLRAGLHPCESKTEITEIIDEGLVCFGNLVGVVGLAGTN